MKNIKIYDLETYPNFFLATFKDVTTGEWLEFEISDRKTDIKELYKFLRQKGLRLVGFNNINFDYPVLHNTLLKRIKNWSSYAIYDEVVKIIGSKYSSVRDKETKIPQLDLYKIWHYDNKNKATSLKWLEFAMRLKNVQDLPYEPGSVLTNKEKDHVIKYCRNDVNATHRFYDLTNKHIDLRKFYTKLEGINLINASEIKMSKEIFSKHLAIAMNMSKYDVSKLRTYRNNVEVKDIIFDYIKFNDPTNQRTLDIFNSKNWVDTSEMTKDKKKLYEIKFPVEYKNVVREYAIGGLHSFGKAGIYESDEEYVLVDVDFASYYPHLSFKNGLHPEHIPAKIFNELYEGFYKERKNYPKKDPRNYVLKIILNGSYGLSKDKYSFLYDPKWQLEICINGQLILTLLTEKILDAVPDAKIIFENTDGAMYRVKRTSYEALEKACKEVEQIVNIPLETQVCERIIARDVNNYISIIDKNNIKFKGVFEIDRDYHKNHSKRVVSLATANYFINNTKPEEFIYDYIKNKKTNIVKEKDYDTDTIKYYEHHDIFDFCLGAKMKGINKLYSRSIDKLAVVDTRLNKMNRYYISNEGSELIKKLPPLEKNKLTQTDQHKIKVNPNQFNIFELIEDVKVDAKDRETNIESGWKCTLFNIHKDVEDEKEYDINYDYYINECYKLINAVENGEK